MESAGWDSAAMTLVTPTAITTTMHAAVKGPAMPSGANTTAYPCDRGTGTPIGWHNYQAGPNGVCCTYCGHRQGPATWPYYL